jgi:V8-like Glu-specific endopeptidase
MRRATLGLAAWTATGCAGWMPLVSEPDPPQPARLASAAMEPTRASSSSLGTPSVGPDDAVVRIVADGVACSGTLIAEDRVLTAHHCVAVRNDDGAIVPRDVEPDHIRVELGGDYLPWGEVGVRELVAPSCGHAAGVGDIAILVLDRPLTGAATLSVRLDGGASHGETVTPVGFGRCAASTDGIRRKQREGGRVDATTATRFRLDAAICPGDSGGPALNEHGVVIGITSASAMDQDEASRDRTEFTRPDAWRSVFATARLVSEGASLAELPPIDGCQG